MEITETYHSVYIEKAMTTDLSVKIDDTNAKIGGRIIVHSC